MKIVKKKKGSFENVLKKCKYKCQKVKKETPQAALFFPHLPCRPVLLGSSFSGAVDPGLSGFKVKQPPGPTKSYVLCQSFLRGKALKSPARGSSPVGKIKTHLAEMWIVARRSGRPAPHFSSADSRTQLSPRARCPLWRGTLVRA